MSSDLIFELRFKNLNHFQLQKDSPVKLTTQENFAEYQLQSKEGKILILSASDHKLIGQINNENLTFTIDSDQNVMKIMKTQMGTNEQYLVLMEAKIDNEKKSKPLINLISQKTVLSRFKGPLAVTPSRKERASLLSGEAINQNFRGFVNLAFIILFATNFRLMVENFLKYGWLIKAIDPVEYFLHVKNYPCITATLCLNIFILIAYAIERFALANSNPKTEAKVFVLNFINISASILGPYFFVHFIEPLPLPALVLLSLSVVLCLKLISFAHVLRNVRKIHYKINVKNETVTENELSPENKEILLSYKDNLKNILTLKTMFYFIAAPTLCFQLQYPRRDKIRKLWLFKRIVELIIVQSVQVFLFIQYILPTIENALPHMKNRSSPHMLERLLKLSIPNIYCWILGFFGFFHLWMNILAELLRFSDREFYLDWWNCRNLDEYWRLWNLPVHYWFIRHIYNPLLKRGISKSTAMIIVFLISAIAHEYLVSASIGIWSFWAFTGMMIQAPIMMVQRQLEKILKESQIGNVMFWISFCVIGQPACMFVYYYLYVTKIQSQ